VWPPALQSIASTRPMPAPPDLAYTAAINVTCAPGSTCTQYVRYHSIDRAGNSETLQSAIVKQNPPDLQPPTTIASAAGYAFGNWTGTSPMSVMLSASDGAGSGIAIGYPKYCIDEANTCAPDANYTGAINITCAAGSNCTQYVRYQSVDNAAIARQPKPAPGFSGPRVCINSVSRSGCGVVVCGAW